MLVPKKRYDEALEIAIEANNKIVTGDPVSDKTDIGPLVSETQYIKVQKLIQSGLDNGANLISGGLGKPQGLETGYYVKPTIFGGVSNDMKLLEKKFLVLFYVLLHITILKMPLILQMIQNMD